MRRRKQIKHLKEVLKEHIGDAAYWFSVGDYKNYVACYARAVVTARQIRMLKK